LLTDDPQVALEVITTVMFEPLAKVVVYVELVAPVISDYFSIDR
jgi:hypothetical protein